jgi:hypothetical protein
MKRMLVLVLALASTISLSAESGSGFGLGIGGTAMVFPFMETTPVGLGGMVSASLPRVPLHISLGGLALGEVYVVSLSADYLFLQRRGAGMIGWYLGAGILAQALIHPDDLDVVPWFGIRAPLGVQVWPLKSGKLEVFGEIAPAWAPLIYDVELGAFEFTGLLILVQPSLGLRYWF